MKRFFKVSARILCGLLVFLLAAAAVAGVWNAVALRGFYRTAEKEFPMPGIEDRSFDEQGIDYDETTGLFFFTGYMRNGTANPVYLVDAQSGAVVKTVRLLTGDGSAFCGHAGGIAVTESFVYIAGSSDCCLYVYDKADLMQAPDGGSVTCAGVFPTASEDADGVKVSFVGRDGGYIYVGEFHLPLISAYRLRDNHQLKTQNGSNSALMICFEADADAPLGLAEKPCAAYSLPDRVQGVCFAEGNVFLSQSFGVTPSTVSRNAPVSEGTFSIMGAEVPLFSLKELAAVAVPPMSEETALLNGKIYIASEFGSFAPSFLARLFGAESCWSIGLSAVS